MDRTVRAVLEGDDAAPGRIAATDVARLVLGLQAALRRAALGVLRRPKRAATGRYEALIEQATKLSFVRVEEGSFAGVMSLPDTLTESDSDMGLEAQDLGYLAWQHLLNVVQAPDGDYIDPWLADAVVKLSDDVNLGGRTRQIRLESISTDGRASRSAVIDKPTCERIRVSAARPTSQEDVLHGRLVEADFERRTARLRRPAGDAVTVEFTDEYDDQIHAALREPGTYLGEVDYSRVSGQIERVRLRQLVSAGEQLQLFGEFHQHRPVAELAAEQGVSGPQQLGSLGSSTLDSAELAEFVWCAEQL